MKDYHKLKKLNEALYHDNLVLKRNFDLATGHIALLGQTIDMLIDKIEPENKEEFRKECLEKAAKKLMEGKND